MSRSFSTVATRAAFLALVPLLASGACAPAEPEAETGAFVILLGTDTVAAERYTLASDRMEVLAVTRSPRTLLREAEVDFDADGGITRYGSRVVDPALPDDEPAQRTEIRYDDDGAVVETGTNGEERRIAAGPEMVPFSLNHFSLHELAVRRAVAAERDTAVMLSDGPMPVRLRRPAPDSVVLETPQLGDWHALVGADGRFVDLDAGALGRRVQRVPALDVDALAERWAEEDARGEGMGPLSPRDTLRATVHGASIEVDYSRPSKRGRTVFGGLVPYGDLWRTGADRATHLSTDRPLRIADHSLPAGTYTLFTIPETEAWTLVVNRQTGQAGTSHDPEQDILQTPMEVTPLEPPEERFTISVEEEGEEAVLRFLWAGTEARIPFRVEG